MTENVKQPTTCKSCVNYLQYDKDERLVLGNKTIRGSILELHLCKRMHPKTVTPYFQHSYGILKSLTPCDLYIKKPVGEEEAGSGMNYGVDPRPQVQQPIRRRR